MEINEINKGEYEYEQELLKDKQKHILIENV